VVTEPDWDTLVVDLPEHMALERKILAFRTDVGTRNGRIGRALPRLFRGAGLAEIDVMPAAFYTSDYSLANKGCDLEHAATLAREAGAVSEAEAGTWVDALRAQAAAGLFWCAAMVFTVSGRRV
jgi:hypothetical protein